MGRQSDTTRERSGAGPTFTCSPMHGCINHQFPGSGLLCESLLKPTKRFRPDPGIEPETSCSAAALATARPTRQYTYTNTHIRTNIYTSMGAIVILVICGDF
ncbi:hypothetical protein B5X24_HaOG204924 [Helicoverpa armigera]|uniref:Uncharacterized protein n=1 Tax=Helicoverpa armigera TaxID=29058 RepID=A0A2W1BTS9_HELAM|nr:hypothetical protein B5X24_HaOG204924 [Helicoverpa armigera]